MIANHDSPALIRPHTFQKGMANRYRITLRCFHEYNTRIIMPLAAPVVLLDQLLVYGGALSSDHLVS